MGWWKGNQLIRMTHVLPPNEAVHLAHRVEGAGLRRFVLLESDRKAEINPPESELG